MHDLARDVAAASVDQLLSQYITLAETVGGSIAGLNGLRLFSALKREMAGVEPYPTVTLFEAANRIMTDLVILYGVRWLLKEKVFPFQTYKVEHGHGNKEAHDILASADGKSLIGEAFNVAPSFFPIKKASAPKKLRASKVRADYRVIMVNADAEQASYTPRHDVDEYLVFVKVGTDEGSVVPNE